MSLIVYSYLKRKKRKVTYEFILQEQANQKACNQYRGTSNYQICLDRTYIGNLPRKKRTQNKI